MQCSSQLYRVQFLFVVIIPFDEFLHLTRNLRDGSIGIAAATDIDLYIAIVPCLLCINLLIEQAMKSQDVLFRKTFLFGNLVDIVVGFGMTYSLIMVA